MEPMQPLQVPWLEEFLRSPHPHAEILKIDVKKAEKLDGVKAIVTCDDLPDQTGGDAGLAAILENCMARGRAL